MMFSWKVKNKNWIDSKINYILGGQKLYEQNKQSSQNNEQHIETDMTQHNKLYQQYINMDLTFDNLWNKKIK